MPRYAVAIFLSAFLLFQIQPMIGKYILPWFGGTSAVWNTCMLFFQLLLLCGYGYAHWLSARRPASRQVAIHGGLVLLCLLVLLAQGLAFGVPLLPGGVLKPTDPTRPIQDILTVLLVGVGLPFFLLSTSNPLLQAWFHREFPSRSPYRLYSLSNVGSLLGLLGYPFAVEPFLPLAAQAWVWVFLFGLYLAVFGLCAHRASGLPPAGPEVGPPEPAGAEGRDTAGRRVLWVLLSATASALLLAVTNQMCQEVAVIPFLWVVPLSVYLITFVIAFDHPRRYRRGLFGLGFWGFALGILWFLVTPELLGDARIPTQVAVLSIGLFFGCMVCHGELARQKPPPAQLTSFYLLVSLGGALGGFGVSVLAPLLFNGYWELHLSLFSCGALFWVVLLLDRGSFLHHGRIQLRRLAMAALLLLVGAALLAHTVVAHPRSIARLRNFYGVMRIEEHDRRDPEEHKLQLRHGLTVHGFQFTAAHRRRLPTSYFGPDSALGIALWHHPRRAAADPWARSLNVGIIGLGAGTMAAYGQIGDRFRFYEINPLVVEVAASPRATFSYVRDSEAEITTVLGDGRLALEQELARGEPQQFDVLIVDAFSSDSIPVHLLTAEAIRLYLAHLQDDGVLLLHISNRHLDLKPVVFQLARSYQLPVARVQSTGDGIATYPTVWMVMSRNVAFWQHPVLAPDVLCPADIPPSDDGWSDDFSNLFRRLK